MKTRLAILLILAAAAAPAWADTIKLKNGGKLEGVIVREQDDEIVIRLKYATVQIDRIDILSVEKTAKPGGPAGAAPRFPRWDRCVEVLAPREWDGKVQQVPALVVETGPLRNVPYLSFRSGDYEFNLYGDPDAPVGIELGIYRNLLKSDAAKKKCADAIADLLGDPKDVEVLRSLGLATGMKERNGVQFEVTPETAEDAFEGWWISVYDLKGIEQARASQEELDRITATKEDLEREIAAAKAEESRRREEERKRKEADRKAAQAAKAAGQPPPPEAAPEPVRSDYATEDEWLAAWYMYGRRPIGPVRVARPRPTPHTPRYYTPGYSRAGGSYRAGPRVGGGIRRR